MTSFRKEKLEDIILELPELLLRHYAAVEPDDAPPPSFNFKKYLALEKAGMYHVATARDDSGKLIGYGLCMLVEHIYTMKPQGYCDVFMNSEDILGWDVVKLCRFVDSMMEDLGAFGNIFATRPKKDISVIYKRLGYTLFETVYGKYY